MKTQDRPQHRFDYPHEAINEFAHQFNQQLAEQVKILLEQKHLYQKVTVEPDSIQQQIMQRVYGAHCDVVEREILRLRRNRLTPSSGGDLRSVPVSGGPESVILGLTIPNVRLFCTNAKCKEKNVFRPIWYQDVSNELIRLNRVHEVELPDADIHINQLLFVALQCQHCKGLPEGFLIRREGWKFSLDGRSPIEHIELPTYVPKEEAALFRDALIAWNTGKNWPQCSICVASWNSSQDDRLS